THLQQAQPTSAAHWLLSRAWPLVRDRERFMRVATACSVLPLGSGAVAGCAFPIDRKRLADRLGFDRVSENATDAVSDRDWAAEFLFAAAMTGVHLSQLAEDLVIFSSKEFGFVTLNDAYTTGSSLMPQKKNPDVAELVRGKSGRLLANVVRLLTVLKGLPTGYNRDLQEDKDAVFDSADTLDLVLPAVEGAVASMTLNGSAMSEGMGDGLFATDLADYLVAKGVPFRESHHLVGELVRLAEGSGRTLSALSSEEMQSVHEAFGEDAADVFDVRRSLQSRGLEGGTSDEALARQLSEIRARLAR
ncbi:MAG: argininosuccinate lyase, partial [Gemmatimonadetes bacterium]|nr:argininosuccinate lyase [Gemmatimonadota bacterium]